VRALIRLMPHNGLPIRDALCLPRAAMLVLDGVTHIATSRPKTGMDVYVPIPEELGKELKAIPNSNTAYSFWTGKNADAARQLSSRLIRLDSEQFTLPGWLPISLRCSALIPRQGNATLALRYSPSGIAQASRCQASSPLLVGPVSSRTARSASFADRPGRNP
jgi:hypothetical protein